MERGLFPSTSTRGRSIREQRRNFRLSSRSLLPGVTIWVCSTALVCPPPWAARKSFWKRAVWPVRPTAPSGFSAAAPWHSSPCVKPSSKPPRTSSPSPWNTPNACTPPAAFPATSSAAKSAVRATMKPSWPASSTAPSVRSSPRATAMRCRCSPPSFPPTAKTIPTCSASPQLPPPPAFPAFPSPVPWPVRASAAWTVSSC